MGPKLEEFEVIGTIGRGSHGTIKKIRRKSDGELMVWKELHYASMSEAEKQGLVLEVNLLRELHHPNIVRFYNHLVERQTGMLYIFMEYCPGGDLQLLVSKCRKSGTFLEEMFIWQVLKQVCEALRACHEKATKDGAIILHRDIKPANVFMDKDKNIKVGDFGLARTLNSDASFARTFVGTPYYMSPEVIDGREYNEQSDIWSLGCLIYELCALEPPFKASSRNELYSKIKTGKYQRIPIHYSNDLWNIIQEMLTREDFLRPGAFLILHNSTLKRNTTSNANVADESLDSLLLSLCIDPKGRDESVYKSGLSESIEDSSYLDSCNNTVQEREKSEEELRMEESLMKEVENMLKESQQRKEKERQERLQGNKLNINLLALTSEQDERAIPDTGKASKGRRRNSICLHERIEKELSPPKCVCGGTTWEEWKERLRSVRESEAAVRKREMDVEERERELTKREKRIQAVEQEAKQHLVRAQLYLKQTKMKIPSFPLPPKLKRVEDPSDFDATTVSADIGYDDAPTVAYLDTQAKNNPFLKMRENKNQLNRCNTIDNPKSRRKHGNCFYLERGNEISKHKKDGIFISNDNSKNSNISTMKSPQSSGRENVILSDKANVQPVPRVKNENKNSKNQNETKGNGKTFLHTFRQNLTKRSFRKENNAPKEKKLNIDQSAPKLQRKPLQSLNSTRFESKGVCAKPVTLKPQVKTAPPINCGAFEPKYNAKDRVLRIYNDM